jgi:hypothetical protein
MESTYCCHFCGKDLVPGERYTLECSCGSCHLSFDRVGELISYKCDIYEDGKLITISRHKFDKSPYCQGRGLYWNSGIDVPLIFEDGMPQVEKLYHKMKKLVIFS